MQWKKRQLNRRKQCGGKKRRQNMKMGKKAPPKPQSGGRKRPRTNRAEKVWGQKVPSKCKSGGRKAPSKQQSDGKKRHHSDKREKSYGGGKCHQNGKVVAENATKTIK